VPLFYYLEEIASVFTKEDKVKDLLVKVLPLIFICYFFDVVQAQRQGVIRGLSLQKSAAWITMFCYYGIAIPVSAFYAFSLNMGVEGLRAGLLVGQLALVTLYTILIDCLTNWQTVADQTQVRLK